ncbi:MAG: DUF2207 domain-containing protein [Candidatus Methanosuratus sp.]|nr:DUF2207 domain-containing protein [Candidatus Methanosuratincola sp.]
MNELRQVSILIGIVTLIGIAGLYLTGGIPFLMEPAQQEPVRETSVDLGDAYVDSYLADLYLNGTLIEKFSYQVDASRKYRMLYRSWKMPLIQGRIDMPYIELLDVVPPPGAVPYVKYSNNAVKVLSVNDSGHRVEIESLAEQNEAGAYYPQMFPAGRYQIGYAFRIHPYLECDQDYCHWNLKLDDEHLPYRQLVIRIHDPEDLIVQLFTHPEMESHQEGDLWVITGASPKDGLIEVEMLLLPGAREVIDGIPREVSNIYEKTLSAQEKGYMGSDLLPVLRSLVAAFPLLLIVLYLLFGREKHYTVPKTLSTIPAKRKPWLVNMVFKDDPHEFEPDGFYATLLDLHKRKIIELGRTSFTEIRFLPGDWSDLDRYERVVLDFLKANSRNDVFSARGLENMVKNLTKSHNTGKRKELRKSMEGILQYRDDDAVREFAAGRSLMAFGLNKKRLIMPLIWTALILIFVLGRDIASNPAAIALLILGLQSTAVALAPSTLLGRWKKDYYKEKLEWDAFRNFLSDYALIRRYSADDLDMWKEWLIYGTALGVGDTVEKAMMDLNIAIPEAAAVHNICTSFVDAFSSSMPDSSDSGGGFGFGGGGGGGGGGIR